MGVGGALCLGGPPYASPTPPGLLTLNDPPSPGLLPQHPQAYSLSMTHPAKAYSPPPQAYSLSMTRTTALPPRETHSHGMLARTWSSTWLQVREEGGSGSEEGREEGGKEREGTSREGRHGQVRRAQGRAAQSKGIKGHSSAVHCGLM